MGKKNDSIPLRRPKCSCGAGVHRAGGGEGPFTIRKTGQKAVGAWYWLECRKRKSEPDQGHFREKVNFNGDVIDLSRRFKEPGSRPPCWLCAEPMRAHAAKETRHHGAGRYFACGNSRCVARDHSKLYLGSWEKGWKPAGKLARGRTSKAAGIPCPRCGNCTLAARGSFPATQEHPKKYPRYECLNAECREKGESRAVFRLIGEELVAAPPPGFQRAYDPPTCSTHDVEMVRERKNEPTVESRRVHRWKCPRAGCDQRVVIGSDGKPIDYRPATRPPREAWPKCRILTCYRPIPDYAADRRNHYCLTHRKLTRIQRHRLNRRHLIDLAADARRRLGYAPVAVIGSEIQRTEGVSAEFAVWLRAALEKNEVSIPVAAERAGMSKTTVWNWSHGESMPRSERDFKPLGDVLGYSLQDFYVHTNPMYQVRTRPSLGPVSTLQA